MSYENVLASAIAHDPAATSAYVDSLLNEIKTFAASGTQDEEQLKSLRIKFPRGGILGILELNPTSLSKCEYGKEYQLRIKIDIKFLISGEEIAAEYTKLGIFAPINSLWCHYLNSGKMTEAKSAWETLKLSPIAIGFQPVCRHMRQHSDLVLAETLVDMLTSSQNVKPSALGIAYSAWIDVHRK